MTGSRKVRSKSAVRSATGVSLKKRRISASAGGYAVPYWRTSIASRMTMPAAAFELGESIQSRYS